MGLKVEMLRRSFERALELRPGVTGRFYEILFARFPRARRLFGRPSAEEQLLLLLAVDAVIDLLEDAPWLSSTMRGLGGKYAGQVTDETYAWIGESLIATLAEALGEEWTPALRSAWAGAYGAVVGLILSGAHEARAA